MAEAGTYHQLKRKSFRKTIAGHKNLSHLKDETDKTESKDDIFPASKIKLEKTQESFHQLFKKTKIKIRQKNNFLVNILKLKRRRVISFHKQKV